MNDGEQIQPKKIGQKLTAQEENVIAAELDKAVEAGGKEKPYQLAERLGVGPRSVIRIRDRLIRLGFTKWTESLGIDVKEKVEEEAPPPPPEELHDARFWRSKANKHRRDVEGLSALVRELGGLDGITVGAPAWSRTRPPQRASHAVLIVHNSDRHIGEVVNPDELAGWNGYNIDIAEKRIKRFMDASCELGRRWTADAEVDSVLYTMGGDEISGDIHDELKETNELTSLEQVQVATSFHIAGLNQLADEYGSVHVVAVPGNHGRTTRKPTAKRYGALSYDIMIAKMVATEFRNDDRITFEIAAGPDAMVKLYDRNILVTHGDKIGTRGGMGFAGPVLPIIRGGQKVRDQYASVYGSPPDLILMGHYHTSANPPGILANGSLPGYSEYGNDLRSRFDVPRQWLGVYRSNWGLTERVDVQLADVDMGHRGGL